MTSLISDKKFLKDFGISKKEYLEKNKNLNLAKQKLKENTILYRGVSYPIQTYQLRKRILDYGYSSTSFDKNISRNKYAGCAGTVIIINAPKGTKGIYIRQSSIYPNDMEWLLPLCSELEIYEINKEKKEIYTKIIKEKI
jgi:hypothetical protein